MESVVITAVTSLFMIMLIGVYTQRRGIISPEVNKGLNIILVNISLPMLIMSSFMTSFDNGLMENIQRAFLFSFIAYLIVIIVTQILAIPIKGSKKNVVKFANIFTNGGFMGIPILYAIYGAEGVIYGAVLSMFFNILVFTYGIILYKGIDKDKDIKKQIVDIIKNPVMIATVLGLVIMFFSIKLPTALVNSIKYVGSMTTPLSMITIGYILGRVKIKEHLKDWTIYYVNFTKLIIMPLLIIMFFKLIGHTSNVANSVIIQMALPTATLASIFSERFEKEVEYSTIIVVTTTLLSMITIPIIVGLFA